MNNDEREFDQSASSAITDTLHREKHGTYIAAGNCPSVDRARTWCNLKAGHASNHHAAAVPSTSPVNWTDRESVDCACRRDHDEQ